ncbi:FAD/FMN-containing dehydrogenase [Haladaptatus litoreus]|uniref:D-lactate dehydrogenase (cytochrome) n=1 Tax=Haladaptatus litoreus TaxID=553468 RepID=A0A1N6WYC1_9EURY|nr:FAD-binding oxidoreductase [Haladaptatus litoreus]SIQ95021.1 FAD/FMN-containing dehydrogenase [Haladaptatus litoreus]
MATRDVGDTGSADDATDPARDDRANYDYHDETVQRPGLVSDLERLVEGEVRFDEYSRQLYATDASAYEVTPIGVVFPTSTADVSAVMSYCAEREIPVLPRGGGTSLAGQSVNEAVVLDFTRHMDGLLDFDPENRTARAQPGIVLGELNRTLAEHELKFAPDPAWGDKSALGGAIGNNSTGSHSLKYGKTDAYVEECEVVLADGTVTRFGEITMDELRERADSESRRDSESADENNAKSDAKTDLETRIYTEILRIVEDESNAVRDVFPQLKRNVSGYNLDRLVEESENEKINVARLLAGSEGTLAIITEATVSLEPVPETKSIALLTYDSLIDAMGDVAPILDHEPSAVEVLDDVLISLARDTEEFRDVVEMLPEGTESVLLVEFYAEDDEDGREKVAKLRDDREGKTALSAMEAHDKAERARFWKLRKSGLPILLSRTSDAKHISFIEDAAVPPENLPEYVEDFQQVLEENDTFASFYAHAGPGCLHIRPLVNTKSPAGVNQMEAIADSVTDLVVKYGGSVSGEHGDGRARTQWNRKLYGDHVWGVFRDLKTAFDPDWLLNPGQVCGDVDMTENLRFDPKYEFDSGFDPVLDWQNENGFQGMVELCHGCGGCRGGQETTGGVMCPTYRAADEEITSTRGRANMLRQAMSGELEAANAAGSKRASPAEEGDEQFDVEFMHEVLDLCIGCKGCARDCPSGVDMAKLKAEVEHEHHERHGASLRDKLFANIDRLSALGSRLAPVSNWATKLPGSRLLAEKTVGIARERSLPKFHDESLEDWFESRGGGRVSEQDATRRVLLFPDTYTNYNHPEAGKAAIRVLESAGVHVRIPNDVTASGRPAHSKGFLDTAREQAETNVSALAPFVRDGWDVVVVEPSDAVMFQSDYLDLLPATKESGSSSGQYTEPRTADPDADGLRTEAERLAANAYGICEYLDRFDFDLPLAGTGSLTYHGHCHQKATKKDHHAVGVLRRAGYEVDALDSGCCGMAGSFGYEAEHYSMSKAVGSILFDQVEESDGIEVVAPGASCRTQLGDWQGAEPPHPIEKIADALR